MNNEKSIRLLTKEEMAAVAGGHKGADGEDCGFEHITVTAPSYPAISYQDWYAQQNVTTWNVQGNITANGGVISGSIGAGGSLSGTDLNNDGLPDTDREKWEIYDNFMKELGYSGGYYQEP